MSLQQLEVSHTLSATALLPMQLHLACVVRGCKGSLHLYLAPCADVDVEVPNLFSAFTLTLCFRVHIILHTSSLYFAQDIVKYDRRISFIYNIL